MKPLTDEALLALLQDLESDRAERKQAWKGDAPEKVAKPFVPLPMTCPTMACRACFLSASRTMARRWAPNLS